jgi:hypothetical protein
MEREREREIKKKNKKKKQISGWRRGERTRLARTIVVEETLDQRPGEKYHACRQGFNNGPEGRRSQPHLQHGQRSVRVRVSGCHPRTRTASDRTACSDNPEAAETAAPAAAL